MLVLKCGFDTSPDTLLPIIPNYPWPNDDDSWDPLWTPVAGAGKVIFMMLANQLSFFYMMLMFVPHPKASQG